MKTTTRIILGILFVAVSALFVYPLLWMVLLSFKTQSEMYTNAFGLPRVWLFSNYAKALTEFAFLRYFMNSVIYAVGSVALTLLSGSLFAYAAARMRWKLGGTALGYVTLGLTIPLQVIIIPLFLILKYGHLTNTYPGLILPLTAYLLPMTILIFYGFMRTLPYEVEEAAFMEGSSMSLLFFRIIVPLIQPAIATAMIVNFINVWNEFFMPFMLITTEKMAPVPIGLMNFMSARGIEWGLLGAVMVVTSIPTVVLFLVLSERIQDAMTVGAILK